ncbi:hypothetical protein AHAS_Ahas11G0091900 [Arachis hypogaea]
MAYMAGQSGRICIIMCTGKGLREYVMGMQQPLSVTLEGKVNADMVTTTHYTQTPDNRLGSLFWADGEMMSDYQLFGDVLAFDSTYRSNKYKKPLVVFSGLNHHNMVRETGAAQKEPLVFAVRFM